MTLRHTLDQMDPDQYVTVGAVAGSGYFFAGKAKDFRMAELDEREVADLFVSSVPNEPYTLRVIVEGNPPAADLKKKTPAYWTISDAVPTYRHKTRITNMAGFYELRQAIALSACKDYESIVTGAHSPGSTKPLEEFFKSDYGEQITGSDGEKVMEVCRIRARYNAWRAARGCGIASKCSRKTCRHYGGKHFLDIEKPTIRCPKEEESLCQE